MSTKSRSGKLQWQARQAGYPVELADGITNDIAARASARMDRYAVRGLVPLWLRAKAAARGQMIAVPTKEPER